ncbi:hypothetical protein HO133_004506 [Letharia lupina]|uniref:Amine oxidase domain-containing protein n=1 Tax=Letharia lupina TaxID=560253 RepID=A0A8H6FKG3_9LECA|nr:uncharacterized protein HO133_004506 [Letharia lupina]KAF6230167.1 hypothetical protein HO133_004506 [Letharia lupina]
MIRRVLPNGRIPHVCVVGAGISGLRCAEVLAQQGLKVTILEGRDRIGGRVHQFSQQGHLIDLGPNWIHGTDHNPILDLAEETHATTFSPPEDAKPSLYDELGHLVEGQTAKKHSELVWEIISNAFRYSRENGPSIPPQSSLMDFFRSEVKGKGLNDVSSKLILQMARMWGDFVGEPIEKQSLRFFWLEECIEGENLFLASTYKSILDLIAKGALARADLQISTKVTSFKSNIESGQPPLVTITTASNDTLNFDEVIVTCPLGWLKRNVTSFSPTLPSRITTAIEHISYGRLEKVYFTFPTAFWLSSNSTGTVTTFFSQFLPPTYASDQNPERWTTECVSLASLPGSCAHPTLLFYFHGPCAQHVTSLIQGLDPASKEYFSRLDAFFQPYYSLLPDYSSSSPDCKPSGIFVTNWQNDELAGFGSYTTFQASDPAKDGEVQLDKDIEALREGCPERGIWFAGEHTAPFVALGTVTGAYWSGEGVAKRVAEVYGLSGGDESKQGSTGQPMRDELNEA